MITSRVWVCVCACTRLCRRILLTRKNFSRWRQRSWQKKSQDRFPFLQWFLSENHIWKNSAACNQIILHKPSKTTNRNSHLRVTAPFQALRLHNMADPLQIQFIYSFIYFESANSFTLTDSRRARRLLKTLTWTITGGPFMKSNNYAYFDRRHSWVQKQCYSQARAFVSALELPDQIPPSWWIFS